MRVNNVFAGYSNPTALGKRNETNEAAIGATGKSPGASGVPGSEAATALGDILAQYDVTAISPAQFSEMIQKLYQAGAISERELQELSLIRLDLYVSEAPADEPIDLLDFYTDKLEDLQDSLGDPEADADMLTTGDPSLSTLRNRLAWIEKFAIAQSAPDAIGLNALA